MNYLNWIGEQKIAGEGGRTRGNVRLAEMLSLSDGYATLRFDGAEAASEKRYKVAKHITDLSLSARVVCIGVSGTYIVIAQI